MKKEIFYIPYLFICLTLCANSFAQSVEVSLNRNTILIGEQISLGLKVKLPSLGYKANFSIPDSITHFDILRKDPVQAVKGETSREQIITLTSFDSGRWYFPAIPVVITDGARRATIYSDSILINVGYAPADSSGQLRDVKQIMDVHIPDYTLYYIIAGILLLLLISYLIYRYLKKRKKRPVPLFKSDLSPYDEAMKAMQQLEQGDLLSLNKEKDFYTELAAIFKRYYSRKQQKNLLNKTTGDVLIVLNEDGVKVDHISRIAEGLRYTDAVKFAKFKPIHSESRAAVEIIKQGIDNIEKNSPINN